MNSNKKLLALAVAAATPLMALNATADDGSSKPVNTDNIEEVVVTSRLKSSAEDVVMKRLEHEAVTDLMSSEMIQRIGDSSVATVMRRVPGVTLVDDKFIYVRGLGERYSNTLLNGASVPSPDLTRNVLPLDIFPTSIVESLSLQKGYTPDMPAAFGGGTVNIITKGIPHDLIFTMELGTSYNSTTSGSGLSYKGGGDDWLGKDDGTRALPAEIRNAFDEYQGDISAINIFNMLKGQDSTATFQDAQAINRALATSLNRDLSIVEDKFDNISGEVNVGNRFYFDNGMEFGFLTGVSYDQGGSTSDTTSRIYSNPQEWLEKEKESTRSVDMTANLNLGFRLNEDNEISSTSLLLRNTDDVARISDSHNDNRPLSSGAGFRDYDIRFEEREMLINQIKGSHIWGNDTRSLLGLEWLNEKPGFLDQLQLDWYYSESEVNTDIPNEVTVRALTQTDPITGEVLASSVQRSNSMADYRFTNLEDEVLSEGWELSLPIYVDNFDIKLSGGWDYVRKNRTYRQTDLRLGSTDPDVTSILDQPLSDIFSDENINNDDFGFNLDVSAASARSYLAATTNESAFFKADVTWQETWRFLAGARYEEFVQVGLPWEPLVYNTDGTKGQISLDPDELREAVFTDDKIYPSFSVMYMRDGFWAETFQLRFGYSETVVRPDLREIADISYLDPLTGALVYGNPNVVPSDVTNFDLRAEWFFESGDNFTVSLFYKEIENPIEFFERAASDTKVASEVINGESADLKGVELEWLKDLSFLGENWTPFFLSGNFTWLDHELVAGNRADSPTNAVRGLAGASDYVINFQLGFDSDDGKHAAALVYNVFGERLYAAGRLGNPDSFEQPFHSLDLTYSLYLTDRFTIKAKLKNMLSESLVIQRGGVDIFNEDIGPTGSISLKWAF